MRHCGRERHEAVDASLTTRTSLHNALSILRNTTPSLSEKRRELRQLAEPDFDFTGMARSSLGFRWRDLSPDQKTRFVQLFTAFIEDAYLNKIQDYSGETIEFVKAAQTSTNAVEVYSKVIKKKTNPIPLDFMLRRSGESWKIYDLEVDGISIIANYRNQFARVISRQGFDQLLVELKEKQPN